MRAQPGAWGPGVASGAPAGCTRCTLEGGASPPHPRRPRRPFLTASPRLIPPPAPRSYLLGGLCWFAIPFTMATTMGLGARAMNLPIT